MKRNTVFGRKHNFEIETNIKNYDVDTNMQLQPTWIIEDILAVGQMIQNQSDLNVLNNIGIRAIINLQNRQYPVEWDVSNLQIHHIPIKDMQVPTDKQVMDFLKIVQHHFELQEPIYVHCTAGCGRTGTMVGIWLASLQKWDTMEKVIEYLRSKRPCAIETKEQIEFVEKVGKTLLN